MRAEYRREDLGKGVRGKYFTQYAQGTKVVLVDDKLNQARPAGAAKKAVRKAQ